MKKIGYPRTLSPTKKNDSLVPLDRYFVRMILAALQNLLIILQSHRSFFWGGGWVGRLIRINIINVILSSFDFRTSQWRYNLILNEIFLTCRVWMIWIMQSSFIRMFCTMTVCMWKLLPVLPQTTSTQTNQKWHSNFIGKFRIF